MYYILAFDHFMVLTKMESYLSTLSWLEILFREKKKVVTDN